MKPIRNSLIAMGFLIGMPTMANAEINVVTSIKPVHSLVSSVMEGVGTPNLLIDGAGSPHNYALKPSQAQELQNADLVFWIGHDLEAFLENSIDNIAKNAVSVSLMDSHGLTKLPFREGGAFDAHDHGGHDEHGHDEHGHDEHGHDEHGHDEHAKDEHAHEEHGEFDAHVWLDPQNAKAMVHEIEEHLAKADPQNATFYASNAKAMMLKLDALTNEIGAELAPVKKQGYVVFHDAYQYFETRFGVSAIGSITVSPEVIPGAERIRELQEKLKSLNASCVFSEPHFEPKLIETVTQGTNAGRGILDPLGAGIDAGQDHYFNLMRGMAKSLKECLSK